MKIITVIGARPQFIKSAVVSKAFQKAGLNEYIIHTGQHFDANMSDVFFQQLGIPEPRWNLGISSLGHGAMTGRMLEGIESILTEEKPDWLLVYGDTNSTLAGALAAAKLHIPVAHVEAGLRSFNMKMPEEINRILTDRISELLFCPTQTAVEHLQREAITQGIHFCGDVMYDSALHFGKMAKKPDLDFPSDFLLCTVHRAENTDDASKMRCIVDSLNEIHATLMPVVMPLHPRTKGILEKWGLQLNFQTIEPVGYLEMLWLLKNCKQVATDSGGLQKEAFFFEKPCLTLRDETEWVELLEMGVNKLCPIEKSQIADGLQQLQKANGKWSSRPYGNGDAADKIAQAIGGES